MPDDKRPSYQEVVNHISEKIAKKAVKEEIKILNERAAKWLPENE